MESLHENFHQQEIVTNNEEKNEFIDDKIQVTEEKKEIRYDTVRQEEKLKSLKIKTVSFKLSHDDIVIIKKASKMIGLSFSSFIRYSALKEAKTILKKIM